MVKPWTGYLTNTSWDCHLSVQLKLFWLTAFTFLKAHICPLCSIHSLVRSPVVLKMSKVPTHEKQGIKCIQNITLRCSYLSILICPLLLTLVIILKSLFWKECFNKFTFSSHIYCYILYKYTQKRNNDHSWPTVCLVWMSKYLIDKKSTVLLNWRMTIRVCLGNIVNEIQSL